MLRITGTSLAEIRDDFDEFARLFREYAWDVAYNNARLVPRTAPGRLEDAHTFWVKDLDRLTHSFRPENAENTVPDHFKHSAHLAYWVRRQSPVVDFLDGRNPQDGNDHDLTETEVTIRDLLYKYGNEYMAFDLGFQFCSFHERLNVANGSQQVPPPFDLDFDYIQTICYFLKGKNVSPHALFLIYKSLFYGRYD